MLNKDKKIYIGSAWPYANGSLHLGHASALIGADILARYFRQSGAEVLWTSGSDCHGTPIEVEAEKQKKSPEEVANKFHKEFVKTLIDGLDFSYDNYTTTLTKNHEKIVQEIFLKLYEQGDIYTKVQHLPYCNACKRFLPDRYIEGECPHCHFNAARGDQCDECGNLLDANELISPKCKTCSNKPEFKDSEHFFLKLSKYQKEIEEFLSKAKNWRVNALGFTKKYLKEGLQDRAVSRDTSWGIPIPLKGYENKSIYVWFEAVSGYFTASIEWAQKQNNCDAWRDFWQNKDAYHYYVHGKDNIPFHSIIWPVILMAYDDNLHLPDSIISSEYLTLEKSQFSKSRHHAVWLPEFLKDFDSESLRYFLIANGPETSDADFSWLDFGERINKELIGNFSNFIYRTLQLVEKNFDGELDPSNNQLTNEQLTLDEKIIEAFQKVADAIEKSNFREGIKTTLGLAEEGNKFLAKTQPWKNIEKNKKKAASDLTVCIQTIYSIGTLIEPFLPKTAEKINSSLGKSSHEWKFEKIKRVKLNKSKPLFKHIEKEELEEQIANLKN